MTPLLRCVPVIGQYYIRKYVKPRGKIVTFKRIKTPDTYGVKVLSSGKHVGWLQREISPAIAMLLDMDLPIEGKIIPGISRFPCQGPGNFSIDVYVQ